MHWLGRWRGEGITLLKNEDGILPLQASGSVGIIGAFAKNTKVSRGR